MPTSLGIQFMLSAAGRPDTTLPSQILLGHSLLTVLFPLTSLHVV